ncbi:NB-ARC domain-containing protein [Amycolatopsis sp. A1MSW2902]|uniref:NB-ARC domain-containing protein n=1 Tax=Amycolatopsis sp. A1MSW2902 TaxID=687413 RepID=UPI00307ECB37
MRDRYPDGQWYVQLSNAGGATAASVLADALRSTRMVDGELPSGAVALSAMWRDAVADKHVLLVLDDVLSMPELDLLLPGTASCAVIATSRRRLATSPGILQLRVEPMTDVEAADLLAGIIGRQRFREQPDASQRLITLCGGNPMAVRETAAYLMTHRQLPVRYLADGLTDNSDRTAGLLGWEIPFQRVVRLSYEMLTPLTQNTLRRIVTRPGMRVTVTTLAKLTGGQAHLVVEDLIAANLASVVINGSDEPNYLVNAALLDYVRVQLAAPESASPS